MHTHCDQDGSDKPAPAQAEAVAWAVSRTPVAYEAALRAMETRAAQIARGEAPELVWLLEHPPIYTAGTSARPDELLQPGRFPVHATGRGGRYTYHGPGQRIVYVMLDVKRRSGDVRAFVHALEAWIIDALAGLGVAGETREGRVGIWVRRPDKGPDAEDKIAAIGLRLRKWVSLHGLSLNVSPDLAHYAGIVPCGIAEHGVTSLAELAAGGGVERAGLQGAGMQSVRMETVDNALKAAFERRFGPVVGAPEPLLDPASEPEPEVAGSLARGP
jgi:lipoyl(octanoyl) transferase